MLSVLANEKELRTFTIMLRERENTPIYKCTHKGKQLQIHCSKGYDNVLAGQLASTG
jgi:hypothetical protein